jgi:hypothetical protein
MGMADNQKPDPDPKPQDARMIPGGSFAAARRPIGVTAMDHYTTAPVVKASLPDLSETPGWNMMPKSDRR